MRLFKQVAIIGVGLIGGSIALALKKKHLAGEVIGISRHRKTLLLAKRRKAIDKGSLSLEIIKNADLLIFATPPDIIIKLAPVVSSMIKKECIVTDVGSTKEEIVSSLQDIFPNYIGSHPLAGSEKRSILNADGQMFKDSLCILTPTKNTNQEALKKIKVLWHQLGAKTVLLPAKMHDKILSFTSHLPHIVAFSLIDTIPLAYLKFASTGLKDTTRIAGSDSQLWVDILSSNADNLIKNIDAFRNNLSRIKLALQKKDKKKLHSILKLAKAKRDTLRYLKE